MNDTETLGVVGGGQLGRMLAEAAAPLGVEVVVLDPTPDCPASPVARDQIVAEFDDETGVRELASRADYLTYEIELADPDLLEAVEAEYDVPVHPDPATLRTIQDKLVQKRTLREAGIPVPEFRRVDDRADLEAAVEAFGYPVMLKAREGGYDGRGNVPVESEADLDALDELDGPAMAERFVEFEREVSIVGAKGTAGHSSASDRTQSDDDEETAAFPLGENVHREEILRETVVPARTDEDVAERAREVAEDVLDLLSGRGVYGIELFETPEGQILVNEIAPRPHNSGHYTIEGALTSQFEQHARAVTGRPLGATDLRSPVVMANVLGDVEETRPADPTGIESVLAHPGASFHWYGKRDVRPLRKMAHLTLVGECEAQRGSHSPGDSETADAADLLATARDLRDEVTFR